MLAVLYLALIQLGGLGLMTFAVLVFSALGMPIGLTHSRYLREDLKQTSFENLHRLSRSILRVVLLAEGVGAALLCLTFVPRFGLADGLWHAVFHAISAVVVFSATFLMVASHDGRFMDISFEVASAFGTTGLSRGYTAELNGFGRAVIIALMFLGRVGPLTLGFFLATRAAPRVRYPEGQVHLG